MRSTTTYKRGQVVVIAVPFSDRSGFKVRPALVVSSEAFHRKLPDLIVCPISSQSKYFEHPGPGDHPLEHWRRVGLHYPSTARISNVVALEKRMIRRALGSVSRPDLRKVEDGLRVAFGL
jgi:mRNA interferase MazF